MKSSTLPLYKRWLANATPEQVAHVDSIYAACEAHYNEGGDVIVECYSPEQVLEHLVTIEDARVICNARTEQAKNCRWGEDSDRELRAPEWKGKLAR